MRLYVEHEGVLYRNPRPGMRAECAFLPNVLPLNEGSLLCVYRIGQAFYSNDGKLSLLRSCNGGTEWMEDGLLWDPANDPQPHNYTAPHASCLRDGTLLVVAFRFDVSDPEATMSNDETGGFCYLEKVLFKSTDNGHTWEGPHVIDLSDGGSGDVPSQIIELNNGRLFVPVEVWKSWDDRSPLHIKGFGLLSDDGGQTWSDRVEYPSASNSEKMFSHTRYTRMLDGRILGLHWTQSIGGQENFDLHRVISDESATKWSEPVSTGLVAQTCWPADLGEGRIAVAYTRREGSPVSTLPSRLMKA